MKKEEYNNVLGELIDTEKQYLPFIVDSDQYELNGYLIDVFYIDTDEKEYLLQVESVKSNDPLGCFKLSLYNDDKLLGAKNIRYNDIYRYWNDTVLFFLLDNGIQEKDLLKYSEVAK